MLIKRTEADRWFSLCVRERSEWACEYCGGKYERGAQGLHCSHLWSRRHKAVRHDPDNAFAHCFGCHQRLGGDPAVFVSWARGVLGESRFECLAERHRGIRKWNKRLEKEIAAHYKKAHEEMISKRGAGVMGRLEFPNFNG